jgi:hypothetical protein
MLAPVVMLSPAHELQDEPEDREFSQHDWERLWQRFLDAVERNNLPVRTLRRLHHASPDRYGELIRLTMGRLKDWRFESYFEALACEVEHLFQPRPATKATLAWPGSIEKIAALAARAERGEELYHPDDETIPLCSPILE